MAFFFNAQKKGWAKDGVTSESFPCERGRASLRVHFDSKGAPVSCEGFQGHGAKALPFILRGPKSDWSTTTFPYSVDC